MNEHDDTGPVTFLLEGLAPAAPSADLMQRLLAARPAITPAPPKSKFITLLPVFARAAVVAAVAGAATWFLVPGGDPGDTIATTPSTAAPAVSASAPQQSFQRLLGMKDLGFARDAQHRPVRLMHATWLDDNTYIPSNGAPPVRESRLRDEIVPMVLTTY